MANDPRNLEVFQAQRMETVHSNPRKTVAITHAGGTEETVSFRVLERVAGIEGGTSASDYVESNEAGKKWLKFYAQTTHINDASTSADQVSLLFCQLSQNSAVIWASICAKFILRVDTPSPGVNYMLTGLHAEAVVANGVKDPRGTIAAAHFRVGREDDDTPRSLTGGTWYALKLSGQFGTNTSTSNSIMTAFIGISDDGGGSSHIRWFLDTLYVTAGEYLAIQAHVDDTDSKPTYYLRVRTPDGGINGYIPIYPTHRATA